MFRADVMQLLGHDVFGDFGFITFAAQVRQIKMLQIVGHDLRGGFGGGDVRQMAVSSENSLLQRPRAARVLKHFDVVIRFEHEHVCGANAFGYELGHVAEVGNEADVCRRRAQKKSNRVLCVVRNRKCFDEQIVEFKTVAGLEQSPFEFRDKIFGGFFQAIEERVARTVPAFFQCPRDGCLRFSIAKNWDFKFLGESEQTGNVVGVLMRDENAGKIFWRAANGREALADLARRKAGVNQDAGIFGFEISAIAGRTAAENRKLH